MQQRTKNSLIAVMMTASLMAAPLAEAKRMGGGKSFGMSRSYNAPAQRQAPRNTQQAQPQNQAQQPQQAQRTGPSVGGMVAAGVAGAAVGAVAMNAMADDPATANDPAANTDPTATTDPAAVEQPAKKTNWALIALMAALGFFAFRLFSRKKKVANPYSPQNSGTQNFQAKSAPTAFDRNKTGSDQTNIFGQPVGSNTAPAASANVSQTNQVLADGSNADIFLRTARQRFNHVQAMNSGSNVVEIERYFTAAMYSEIKADIAKNDLVAEFNDLTAQIMGSDTENAQYVVSVQFTGLVSEDVNSLPQPFSEIWHFVKPINSSQDWLIAGIQQQS